MDRTARIENEEGIWWGDPRSGQTSPGRGVLLGVLDGAIYARLAEAGRPRVFARGAVLMRQGEHAEEMYAIVSGRVSVERAHPALPKPLVLAELGPGDIVGEMGIVLEEPRSATVRALTDVTAIEVSREATLRAFVDLPGLPEVLRRLVARRLAQNDELLARQMAQNVELVAKRVARYVARSQDDLPA